MLRWIVKVSLCRLLDLWWHIWLSNLRVCGGSSTCYKHSIPQHWQELCKGLTGLGSGVVPACLETHETTQQGIWQSCNTLQKLHCEWSDNNSSIWCCQANGLWWKFEKGFDLLTQLLPESRFRLVTFNDKHIPAREETTLEVLNNFNTGQVKPQTYCYTTRSNWTKQTTSQHSLMNGSMSTCWSIVTSA